MTLDRLLNPRSIAIIGGGAWGASIIKNCRKAGYSGTLHVVHPKKDEIEVIQCVKSISDLPNTPDAAFICVNRMLTIDAVRELSDINAGGAICFASGFKEAVAEDAGASDLQAALIQAAGDMPILGPNCYGFVNMLERAPVWPDQHGLTPIDRGVAIIGQSSNMGINLTMQQRALPIAAIAMAGNQANTSMADLGQAFLADDRITALGLHIEGIHDIRDFEALANAAHQCGKKIVAIKVGKSEQAQAATVSHTASLAGSDAGSTALLSRLGIAQTDSPATFLEALKIAHFFGDVNHGTLGSISCSGGEASLIADLAHNTALKFPPLNETQKSDLSAALGPLVALANPLDYHTYIWGYVPKMTAAWSAMIDPAIEILMLIVDFPRNDICDDSAWECTVQAAIALAKPDRKIMMVSSLPENMPQEKAELLSAHGIIPMYGMEVAIKAIEAIYLAKQQDPAPVLLPAKSKTYDLSEQQAKHALHAHGLSIPRSKHVTDISGLEAAANALTFPLVLKGEGFAHKTEAGAVHLDLQTSQEVINTAKSMNCSTFLIEEMIPNGITELLIGVVKDPVHGYVLTIGAGGILTEVMEDSTCRLLPVSETDIDNMLTELRINKLLNGYRGKPAADKAAITKAIFAIQDFVHKTHPDELEINPLIVGTDFAIAADALIKGGTDD
ncbi:MAG: acetate--CoA ligase family protein [Pseudomonadota bacterium]